MRNIAFVADFYSNEVHGGAEIYNDELINQLGNRGYSITKVKSKNISPEMLETKRDDIFIIANFMMLNENCKKLLIENHSYFILEHDHKYTKSNNPALYPNLIVPEEQIQNKDFYRAARAVLAQSRLHAETIQKNLLLNNVINLSCNLWSDEALDLLKENLNKSKTIKFGVMNSTNKNKGTPQSVDYCRNNNLDYDLIPFVNQREFYRFLSRTETLVFFPQWMESFCRVAVEARILGCELITNRMLGCASEPFFAQKGEELLKTIREKRTQVVNAISDLIEGFPIKNLEPIKNDHFGGD